MNGLTIKSKKLIGKKQTYNLEMKSNFHNYIINGTTSKNSHSASYSYITYQTAYLKSNYPVQFMCALLNCNSDDLDKLNLYIAECFRLGITIIPPDVNESINNFTITEDNKIAFGLNAIKGLGKSAVNNILTARKDGKFKSIVDFISRCNKVDKSNIQTLLRVGAFNSLENSPKKWDKMCDYINDAKNSKHYNETTNLERVIQLVVGTKAGKKSDEYLELVELKRGLGGSKQDKLKREEYTEQQNKIIDKYIENATKHFLQYNKYTAQEKIVAEQELLGFNLSTNPYSRWEVFKKYFVNKNGNDGIKYVDLNELIDNPELYFNEYSLYTVGLLSDIKELKTKKGQRMARLTFEYYGSKCVVTVFPKQWENDLENKLQKGNMVSIIGFLKEANKQYSESDYELGFTNMQQLNVLVNENNKCIIDMKGKNKENIDRTIKEVAQRDRKNNLPIERAVFYKYGDVNKYNILCGLCWINNPNSLLNGLS